MLSKQPNQPQPTSIPPHIGAEHLTSSKPRPRSQAYTNQIQPDWMRELLGVWSHKDLNSQNPEGFASVSPMFARFGVVTDNDDEDMTFSEFEIAAAAEAVAKLQETDPQLWQAIHDKLRPWARNNPVDPELLSMASLKLEQIIAKIIDSCVLG